MIAETAAKVYAHLLQRDGSLWWPELTESLVLARRCRPVSSFFPSCTEYSTTRFVTGTTSTETNWFAPALDDVSPRLRVEYLSSSVAERFRDSGLDIANSDEVKHSQLFTVLSKASSLIALAPSLATSVEHLVRSVHIIRQENLAYDVSFSDPQIPFSIFASVPDDSLLGPVRVAEAIIHESMHLQLTLVEQVLPLAEEWAPAQYSPWKRETRPASGVIHALYVFAVIDEWLALLPFSAAPSDYVHGRRRQIFDEVQETDLSACERVATDAGRALLKCISDRFYQR